MSLASNIEKLEELKVRAVKKNMKIEIICTDRMLSKTFAIGSSRIKSFQNHIDIYEGERCKVGVFDTIKELEAFIIAREIMG